MFPPGPPSIVLHFFKYQVDNVLPGRTSCSCGRGSAGWFYNSLIDSAQAEGLASPSVRVAHLFSSLNKLFVDYNYKCV